MKLKLIYSHAEVQKPILAEAILRFNLPINILEANVNAAKGELIVSIDGPEETVESLVLYLADRGLKVERLTRRLQVDEGRCMNCGACVSPCPVSAIGFRPDWTVRFEEEKCVGCGVCVKACPVRAIELLR